jgi:hypothetical protein
MEFYFELIFSKGIVCLSNQFKCRNGTCIPSSKRCNNQIDCADYSDEIDCPRLECRSHEFKCLNGSCIPKSWKW